MLQIVGGFTAQFQGHGFGRLLMDIINGGNGKALIAQAPRHIRAHPANSDKSDFFHTVTGFSVL